MGLKLLREISPDAVGLLTVSDREFINEMVADGERDVPVHFRNPQYNGLSPSFARLTKDIARFCGIGPRYEMFDGMNSVDATGEGSFSQQ
jgi:hypothetical protein